MASKKYVIWINGNRKGKFEFCCSTQQNYCCSLNDAIKEIVERDTDWIDSDGKEGFDVPDSHYIIYEMTLTKVMNGTQARRKIRSI